MRVIIAGSRHIEDHDLLLDAIEDSEFDITEVVEGGARGVDALAKMWATENGIPCITIKADWNKLGKSAGPRRNENMAKIAEALIAVWDGESAGTKHMIKVAKRRGLEVFVYQVDIQPRADDLEVAPEGSIGTIQDETLYKAAGIEPPELDEEEG